LDQKKLTKFGFMPIKNIHTRLGLLIIGLFFLCNCELFAQTQIGLKGGGNFSGFRRVADTKFGWQVGVAGKNYLGDLGWFIQPEIFYSKEGNINQPLEFINVPVILGFDFGDNFNIHTGLQAGFLIASAEDSSFDYKNVNMVVNFGFEFYTFKKTSIGFRFDYGMSDFDKSANTAITYNFGVYVIAWIKQ
jgi:hypothetical protein